VTQTKFERELEIFRTEEETAQQYFFSYLSVRSLAAKNHAVLAQMNTAPLFWATIHHAMLLSAIVALGRIFDRNRQLSLAANRLASAWQSSLSGADPTA
jgi:AbiU2